MATTELPPVSVWQVREMRVTCFPAETPVRTDQQWWKQLFGTPADKVDTDRAKLQHVESGTLNHAALHLRIYPVKIDWVLEPPSPDAIPDGIPTAGPLPEVRDQFLPYMHRWLGVGPRMTRLAFGLNLVQPTADRKGAYELLGRYLHAVRLDPESTDFNYQINRRRKSSCHVPALEVNRLSTWSALRMTVKAGVMAGGRFADTEISDSHGAMLRLDINTAPEHESALPVERLPELLDELVTLALEIAAKGDIR